MAADTSNLNEIIRSNVRRMNIFTDAVREVINNCRDIKKNDIQHVNKILVGYKDIVKNVAIVSELAIQKDQLKRLKNNIVDFKKIVDILSDFVRYVTTSQLSTFSSKFLINNNPINAILDFILNIIKKLDDINLFVLKALKIKLKVIFLRWTINSIYKCMHSIVDDLSFNLGVIKNSVKSIAVKPLLDFFDKISTVVDGINKISIKSFLLGRFKLLLIRSTIQQILSTINDLFDEISTKTLIYIAVSTILLQFVLDRIQSILAQISNFLSFKLILWLWLFGKKKIKRFKKVISYINELIEIIGKIDFDGLFQKSLKSIFLGILKVSLVLFSLEMFFKIVKSIKLPFFLKRKVNRVAKAIDLLCDLIFYIAYLVQEFNDTLDPKALIQFFRRMALLGKLMLSILVLTGYIILLSAVLVVAAASSIIGTAATMVLYDCVMVALDYFKMLIKYITEDKTLTNENIKTANTKILKLILFVSLLVVFGVVIIAAIIGWIAVKGIKFILKYILNDISSIYEFILNFANKGPGKKYNKINSIISSILNTFVKIKSLIILINTIVPVLLSSRKLMKTIIKPSIKFFVKSITELFNKLMDIRVNIDFDAIQYSINNLVKAFGSLTLLMLKITLLVPPILIGIVASIVLVPGFWLFYLTILAICKTITAIESSIDTTQVYYTLDMITDIFISIAWMMMLLAGLAIITIYAWKKIIGGYWTAIAILGGAFTIIFMLTISFKLLEMITTVEEIRSNINSIVDIFIDIMKLIGVFIVIGIIIKSMRVFASIAVGGILVLILSIFAIALIVNWVTNTKAFINAIENIKKIREFVYDLSLISISIILTAISILSGLAAAVIVFIGFGFIIKCICNISKLIEQVVNIEFKKSTLSIKRLKNFLKTLLVIIAELTIIALFMPVGIIAATITWLGLWLIGNAIAAMIRLINEIANSEDFKITWKSQGKLWKFLGMLALFMLGLVLIATVTTIAAVAALIMLGGMIVICIGMLGTALLVRLIIDILGKFKVKNVLKAIGVMVIIGLLLSAIWVLAWLMNSIYEQVKDIDFVKIFEFLGTMLVLLVACAAIGLAVVPLAPILIPAAIAIGVVVGAMVLITGALWGIASMLNQLAQIDLNLDALKMNIAKIFLAADYVISAIFKTPEELEADSKGEEKKSGFWDKVLNFFTNGPLVKLIEAIMTLGYLIMIVGSIYLIKWIADCLNQIQTIKLNRDKIIEGVGIIFDTADIVVNSLSKRNSDAEFRKANNYLNKYEGVIESLGNIQSTLDGIGEAKFTAQHCIDLINIIGDLNKSFDGVDDTKLTNSLNSYDKFLQRIDDIDFFKLKTAANLFEQMAKFSESINGNFEQLADTLNEKIAPLVEELKESLDNVQKQIVENGNKPKTAMEAEKNAIRNNLKANGQTQNLSNNEVEQRVDNKYKNDVQQRYGIDEITTKLTELINLFQNGEARIKTT